MSDDGPVDVFVRGLRREDELQLGAPGRMLIAGELDEVLPADDADRSFFHPDGIPWWVVRTFHRRRRELRQLLQQPKYYHLEVFELRRPTDAERLIATNSSPIERS